MIINDLAKVTISRASYAFDGYRAVSVTDRVTGELIGHVARSNANRKQWCYLAVTSPRGQWISIGYGNRELAVDHLLSYASPCGKFLLPADRATAYGAAPRRTFMYALGAVFANSQAEADAYARDHGLTNRAGMWWA